MITAKKNAAYYLSFAAIDSTTPASYKSGVSPVDTAYYKDGAGAWTSLAITDTASEIGSTGVYEIDLTAAEMNHDKVMIKFSVSGMADDAYLFDLQTKLVDDLQDITTAQVNTECDTAMTDYGANTIAPDNTSIAAILVDTADLQANQGNWLTATGFATSAALSTVDANIDSIIIDTGTDIPALINGLNDLAGSEILTTALAESYSADGAAPTLSQAIFLILQFLYERNTAGTAVTVKKLDGATTAAGLTLDSATTPTSITRSS